MPAAPVHDAETRLAELISALDHLPAMIAYWNRDLRNELANAAYVKWFGVTPDAMRGMHIRDLLGEELFARNLPYIEGALAGEEQLFERVLIDTAGQTRVTQASYVPHVVDGRVQGFFVLVSDISARVRAEQALHESVAQVALLQERQRIAADMHDLVVQSLFIAGLQLQSAELTATGEVLDAVQAAAQRVDEAITALRLTIAGLSRDVTPERLVADLQQVAAACTPALGFAPTVTVKGSVASVPADARPELLAVLQEALTNAAKHAGASSVSVTLAVTPERTRLVVRDDGRGVGDARRSSGLGNMRLRAERLGGRLVVSGNDPHGTVIDWSVPAAPAPVVSHLATPTAPAAGPAAAGTRHGPVPSSSRRSARVLPGAPPDAGTTMDERPPPSEHEALLLGTDRPRFDSPDLAAGLDAMTPAQWDELDFGLIVMDRGGRVTHYNRSESERAGLAPDRVLGRNFFTDVGPCTNNYLIADRFHRLDRDTGELDDTFDYVFTFRMVWTPVRLRLLARPGSPRQYLAVTNR